MSEATTVSVLTFSKKLESEDELFPLEACVFLAVVGCSVLVIGVFFLYLNKSLCFAKCSGLLPPCGDPDHPGNNESTSRKLGGTFDDVDADDTSSDSDDEVLRRYQQTISAGPRSSSVVCSVAREGDRRRSTIDTAASRGGGQKTGIATYLRRDEKTRSYNSDGNTEALTSQATTKFIVGGADDDDDDDDDDDSPEVIVKSRFQREFGAEERSHRNREERQERTLPPPEGFQNISGARARESRDFRHTISSPIGGGGDTVSNLSREDDNLFGDGDILVSRCGHLSVTFHYQTVIGRLTVTVHEARDVPGGARGGARSTQVRLLLLPAKRARHKTKIKPGECPKFEETFHFKLPAETLNSMGLRIRLYGCERMRRERMIGEHVMGFATLSLDTPVQQWLTLEPRSNLSQGDAKADVSGLTRSDSVSSGQSMQHGGMPELLVGLLYNGVTGRLSVQVIKGSNFKNMAMARAPDTYVKLTMMSSNGQEISRSRTSVRRGQPHPLYKETFKFHVAQFQLPNVTLMVSVFYNRSIKRKEMIGWFSLGYSNSSEEELSHWTDMRESKDEEVCRWHVLLEP